MTFRSRFAWVLSFLFLTFQTAFADINHSSYDKLLTKYVSGSRVDYEGIKAERSILDDYLKKVGSASGDLKMAFYLNAYNALVLAAILDNNQPAKVTDVKGFFDAKTHKVAGKTLTLNQLEDYIRSTYKDPRIHFALNCAARSCPPLYGKAFSDSNLESVLTTLTSTFLNGSGVKLDEAKKQIKVTKLMDWYGKDFVAKEGSVEAYLKKWVTDKTKKAALDAGGYAIAFQGYDWTLNKK
jgi:hypothetical protein